VEGVVDASATSLPVENLYLYDPAADNYEGRVSLLDSCRTTMDEDRRFTFENVPPGEYSVFINSGLGIAFHHQTPLVVRPAATTQVVIVETPGTRVSGRFVSPPGQSIAWQKEMIAAQMYLEPDRSPLAGVPASERPARALEFWTSPAGREYINTPRVHSLRLLEDGTFVSVEPLPPGKYRLTIVCKRSSATRHLVIPEEQPAELPLGEIRLQAY
jgi:hypothetical protein